MLAPREIDEYLLPTERRVIRVRMHWAVMANNLFLTGLFLLLLIVAQHYLPASALVDNLTFYLALAAVLRFTLQTILWWIERIVITDKRVMLAQGIITHNVGMMPLSKVTDLTFRAHLRRPDPRLRHPDRRVRGSDPGAQQDQVHAAPGGDLRGAVRADLRGEGQDARHRHAGPTAVEPLIRTPG